MRRARTASLAGILGAAIALAGTVGALGQGAPAIALDENDRHSQCRRQA